MQFLSVPGGGDVAVMESRETLIIESALLLYVLNNPDSNIAVQALRDVSEVNEVRARQADDGSGEE